MTRWSYKMVRLHNWFSNLEQSDLDKMLNSAGEEGWELVSVTDGSRPHLFFKRAVPPDPYRG